MDGWPSERDRDGNLTILPAFMKRSRVVSEGEWVNLDTAIGVAVGAGLTALSAFLYQLYTVLRTRVAARRKALRDAAEGGRSAAAKSTVLVVVEGGANDHSIATIYRDFYIEALDINVKMYFTGLAIAPKLTLSCFDSDQWRTVADAASGTASQITHTPTPLKKQLFLKNARARPSRLREQQLAQEKKAAQEKKKKKKTKAAKAGRSSKAKSWQKTGKTSNSWKQATLGATPEYISRTVRAARQPQFEPVKLEATFVDSTTSASTSTSTTTAGARAPKVDRTRGYSSRSAAATSLAALKRVAELPREKSSSSDAAPSTTTSSRYADADADDEPSKPWKSHHQRNAGLLPPPPPPPPTQKSSETVWSRSMQSPFERDADLMPLHMLYAMTVRPNVYGEAPKHLQSGEQHPHARVGRANSWSPGQHARSRSYSSFSANVNVE
jgi:hypothetical protein